MRTHTHTKPDYAVTTKSFVEAAQAGWLSAKGQSWLQITAGGWPRLVMDLNALCVYPHTCTPTVGRDGSTAESTQPFCNTSRNSLSSPCMRNRWGGAIKWIFGYFPRLLAEDVKPQPVRQPRMTAEANTHTPHSLPRKWSAFMLLCNLSNCLGMWWMGPRSQKEKIHLVCIRLLLCPCNSLEFNYSKW